MAGKVFVILGDFSFRLFIAFALGVAVLPPVLRSIYGGGPSPDPEYSYYGLILGAGILGFFEAKIGRAWLYGLFMVLPWLAFAALRPVLEAAWVGPIWYWYLIVVPSLLILAIPLAISSFLGRCVHNFLQRRPALVRATLVGIGVGLSVYFCLTRWYNPPDLVFSFSRSFDARFEWDSARGFKTFRVQDNRRGSAIGGPLWQYLVAVQIKPRLDSYMRQVKWQRMNGDARVGVLKIIPLASPEGWGSEGFEPEDPDVTPLMRAADNGDTNSVKRLVVAGADVNARGQGGQTALMYACRGGTGSLDLVRSLLAAGADVNARDREGTTTLLLAVTSSGRSDHSSVVRELLAAHADVNVKNKDGETALMGADDVETVSALLAAGADVNARSDVGGTALMNAVTRGYAEVVRALLAARADVNAHDNWRDETPLMEAARMGNGEAIKALLAAGADVNARNNEGETALTYAAACGYEPTARYDEIVQLLKNAGAAQ
jgi:ankyrin repeat protein